MTRSTEHAQLPGRYEFRVWGRYRKAAKLLAELADSSTREQVEDCYLLVDDLSWNAKLRGDSVKIKQLVSERKGFEHWVSERYRSTKSAPSPFDDLLDDLGLDDLLGNGTIDFSKVISRVSKHPGITAIVVNKDRRRYSIGDIRAECTKIAVRDTGETLRTLVIEGDDLSALKALRRRLGISGDDNIAVHHALSNEVDH